jgi:hypothetical protein
MSSCSKGASIVVRLLKWRLPFDSKITLIQLRHLILNAHRTKRDPALGGARRWWCPLSMVDTILSALNAR